MTEVAIEGAKSRRSIHIFSISYGNSSETVYCRTASR